MAITPYVPIPYASERDRYTGRAYTVQQLALMDRQSARESAYASDRAQRMSDRWSGFGGLITETLGDLRQSREVREAKALEQERYDEEQARLVAQDKRSIDLYDRTLLGQQVARIRERTRAGGDLSEADAETMRLWDAGSVEDYERPASEQATLASLAAPAAEMGERAFANALPVEGLLGGGFGTAPDERGPVRFGETFAPVQDIGAGIPAPQIGPRLVAGEETVPATSGTRLRMTAAQTEALEAEVKTDAQYRQQRALSIEALQAGLDNGVLNDTQATLALSHLQEDGTLPSSVMTKLMEDPEEPSYAATAFASFRDSGVQAFRDQYGREPTGAELQTIGTQAQALANPEASASHLETTPRNIKLANGETIEGAFLVDDPDGAYWLGPDMQRLEGEVLSVLPSSASGPTPTSSLAATMRLRAMWVAESSAANQSALQYELMLSSMAAVREGSLSAGSQGILVTFQKILDPGSVVRESEYARSSSGLSLLSQLEGKYQTIEAGGAGVPISVLQEYVDLARQFAENQAAYTERSRAQINRIAEKYDLDPTLITMPVQFLGEDATPTLREDVPDMNQFLRERRGIVSTDLPPGLGPRVGSVQ